MGADGDRKPSAERPGALSAETGTTPSHIRDAWRTWLSALAIDADAALAAAFAYESLPPEARDAWLDALGAESDEVDVPALALYAPLLAVESDAGRRDRIQLAISMDPRPTAAGVEDARALRGVAADGTHACVVVAPLYLDFVQILCCRYTPSGGFIAVRHEPLRYAGDVAPIQEVEGVPVEPTPLGVVVEELAHAILADKREHRETPPALTSVAHLFAPQLEDIGYGEPSLR
jgi:hypothetical protein